MNQEKQRLWRGLWIKYHYCFFSDSCFKSHSTPKPEYLESFPFSRAVCCSVHLKCRFVGYQGSREWEQVRRWNWHPDLTVVNGATHDWGSCSLFSLSIYLYIPNTYIYIYLSIHEYMQEYIPYILFHMTLKRIINTLLICYVWDQGQNNRRHISSEVCNFSAIAKFIGPMW